MEADSHYHEDGHNELYDLNADPGERHDVLSDRRDTAAELWLRLERWLDEVEAKFPASDPQYDAAEDQARVHRLEHELMPEPGGAARGLSRPGTGSRTPTGGAARSPPTEVATPGRQEGPACYYGEA